MSVVIPAYNAEPYIARAIESVLGQSRKAHEIIVVDNGSTDDTASVVQNYQQSVRYFHQANAGVSGARNTGVTAATGEWVAFLDADDEWLPNKLEQQLELLQRNPDLAWTTGNYLHCLCDKNRCAPHLKPAQVKTMLAGKDYIDDYFVAYVNDLRGCTDTMLIKREVLEAVGLFAVGRSRGEDLDMWWRIAYRWPKIGYSPEPLAVYHIGVPNSLTQQHLALAAHYELIEQHLKLSAQCGQMDRFRPCAKIVVQQQIRSFLFEGRGSDVRELLDRFGDLLPKKYRLAVRVLSWFPVVTSAGCRAISWLKQCVCG